MADAVVTRGGTRRTSATPTAVIIPEGRVRSPARQRAALLLLGFDVLALAGGWLVLAPTSLGAAFALNVVVLLWVSDAYSLPLQLDSWRYATRLLSRAALALFGPIPLWLFDGTGGLLRLAMVSAVIVLLLRGVSYSMVRRMRVHAGWQEPAVILGAGTIGQRLATALTNHPEYGLQVLGALDEVPGTDMLPVLGPPDLLDRLIRERNVTRVLLAYGPFRDATVVDAVRTAARYGVDVEMVPRLYDAGSSPDRPEFEHIRGIPLYRLHRAAPHTRSWKAKRAFDIVVSAALLALVWPVLAALAIAVRVSSPGPILFRQIRIGQHGDPFELLKFRSMRVNTDSDETWNVAADDRVTTIGKIMRRTSLDELPQLWNVVRGDMALVGPRPERPTFVEQFTAQVEGYETRHRLPVGLTGLAQVHDARGDTPIAERARMDNHYIEHWSLWRDVRIMFDTVRVVVNDVANARKRR
ncbi:MAG TPA: sugar transferase [Euzebyales bacterium]|nr:sugar transferase [Euzebyales bacterium]